MNSFQLKQTVRSRRNNAQKVQRPLLNFKASKDKAKDHCKYIPIFSKVLDCSQNTL